jgi:DTW domain-containing protein YfiP
MSRRDNVAARCATCHMHATLCICDLVPRLDVRTRLSLLIHYREERKPTNSGLLAARCLPGSSVGIVGDRDRPLELPLVRAGERGLLMFPADDAVPIEQYAGSHQPLVLIVPDGNWRQAGKMRRRVPGLDALPCVALPATTTNYGLRAEHRAGGLATLEAIAHAVAILERDPTIQTAMLGVFRVMVDRTLWLRGALGTADVTGGIPAAAIERDPRGT